MPARILIDGYNLLGVLRAGGSASGSTAARADALEEAREYLLRRVQSLPSGRGEEFVVVFDGQSGLGRPRHERRGAVEVWFSADEESADDVILRLVRAARDRSRILVVTSDRTLSREARGLGARVVTSAAYARRLEQGEEKSEGKPIPGRSPASGVGGGTASRPRSPDRGEKPPPPGREEIARWEKMFRRAERDKRQEEGAE